MSTRGWQIGPPFVSTKRPNLRDESDKAKVRTTRNLWVPGVNAFGGFGRWAFAEFRDWAVMDKDFATLVDSLTGDK